MEGETAFMQGMVVADRLIKGGCTHAKLDCISGDVLFIYFQDISIVNMGLMHKDIIRNRGTPKETLSRLQFQMGMTKALTSMRRGKYVARLNLKPHARPTLHVPSQTHLRIQCGHFRI